MTALPPILGLFQKRVAGDDALLELARLRFSENGLKTELYGASVDELNHLLKFRPEHFGYSVLHLPRNLNVFLKKDEQRLLEFIRNFSSSFSGFVLHDHGSVVTRGEEYAAAIKKIAASIEGECFLFIEYAAGLDFEMYVKMLKRVESVKNVSSCIDIGHVALREVSSCYAKENGGQNIFSLKKRRGSPENFMRGVESALNRGLPAVLKIIREVAMLEKRVHFHLHDGHPLSTISPFGLSDHLGFFERVPIPYEYAKSNYLKPMFGPSGLSEIVKVAMENIGPRNLSMTVEVHATEKRRELGSAKRIFSHWTDLTNAERMNYWLWDLARTGKLIREEIVKLSGGEI